jgi:hypothetical protein
MLFAFCYLGSTSNTMWMYISHVCEIKSMLIKYTLMRLIKKE